MYTRTSEPFWNLAIAKYCTKGNGRSYQKYNRIPSYYIEMEFQNTVCIALVNSIFRRIDEATEEMKEVPEPNEAFRRGDSQLPRDRTTSQATKQSVQKYRKDRVVCPSWKRLTALHCALIRVYRSGRYIKPVESIEKHFIYNYWKSRTQKPVTRQKWKSTSPKRVEEQ